MMMMMMMTWNKHRKVSRKFSVAIRFRSNSFLPLVEGKNDRLLKKNFESPPSLLIVSYRIVWRFMDAGQNLLVHLLAKKLN